MNQLHLREEEFMRKERSENDSFEGRSNFDDFSLASRFHLYEPGEGGGGGEGRNSGKRSVKRRVISLRTLLQGVAAAFAS